MSGFLPDTNIPCELTRPLPQSSVTQWLHDADDSTLYLSAITIGEIVQGIAGLPDSKRRRQLQQWLDATLRPWFRDRILPVNESIAERWGVFAAEREQKGRPLKVADGLIAATASVHDLTVVTRNAKDFAGPGIGILNPWD